MKKYFLPVIMLAIFIEVGVLSLPKAHFSETGASLSKKSLVEYADQVLAKCHYKDKDNFNPGCYDEEIPKLMDRISMEDAFAVTKVVQEKEPRYLYCHVLGHKLSYRETEKDPSKWMDVITRCPATMCNNGCLHGSMMERYKSESLTDVQIEELKPDVQVICEPRGKWNPAPVEISMCYHAIGHLFMYITNADLKKSAELCAFIGNKADGRNYVQTCTQGVFMQIYQPLEPEDYALVAKITPRKNEVDTFCSKFSGMSYMACHVESWPLSIQGLLTSQGLDSFCKFAKTETEVRTCYSVVINMATMSFMIPKEDVDGFKDYCLGLKSPAMRTECFGDGATRLVQIDPAYTSLAVRVCASAEKVGEDCFSRLSQYSLNSFHPGSKEFYNYCDKLPEPWKEKCINMVNK